MSHPPPTVTHTGLRPTKYTPQQQLATATATTSARHACRGERLLAASSQARIGTGVPHGGSRGDRAGCWRERLAEMATHNDKNVNGPTNLWEPYLS